MAWTNPMVFTVGATLTAAQLNANLSGNLNYLRSSATNAVGAQEARTNVTYGDLATAGPAVTVTTDVQAIVTISAVVATNNSSGSSLMTTVVSGASTVAASDSNGMGLANVSATATIWMSKTLLMTGLTAGSNTFTAKYRSGGADTATFSARSITVQPA